MNEELIRLAQATPQSNQRGIERQPRRVREPLDPAGPQSNQRGIESASQRGPVVLIIDGLNRTSVGLKVLSGSGS